MLRDIEASVSTVGGLSLNLTYRIGGIIISQKGTLTGKKEKGERPDLNVHSKKNSGAIL